MMENELTKHINLNNWEVILNVAQKTRSWELFEYCKWFERQNNDNL
jgi:hypothetical protein